MNLNPIIVGTLLAWLAVPGVKGQGLPALEQTRVPVNETELFYERMGSGPPVVIVHGGPGLDHTDLLPQMGKLASTNTLFFFDQRACGKSSAEIDSASMTRENFLEDIEGSQRAFHLGKMNLMGHSWGGLLAMVYALRYPDHLDFLIQMNSSPVTSELREAPFSLLKERTSREERIEQAAITGTPAFRDGDPRVMAAFLRLIFRGSFFDPHLADGLTLDFPSDDARRRALTAFLYREPILKTYDSRAALASVRCPVLVLGGDADLIPRESNELIEKSIPHSQLLVLKHAGHFPFIEAPGQLFPVLKGFLRDGSAAGAC
jgi:proline iminopeptidase